MIPKIIHYCWFGNGELSELAKKCIGSWKKYCPDYEIKQWNETNFDISECKYMKQAYEAKKWGFVPDYARNKIIYENGGFYFDTDVEIVNNQLKKAENLETSLKQAIAQINAVSEEDLKTKNDTYIINGTLF